MSALLVWAWLHYSSRWEPLGTSAEEAFGVLLKILRCTELNWGPLVAHGLHPSLPSSPNPEPHIRACPEGEQDCQWEPGQGHRQPEVRIGGSLGDPGEGEAAEVSTEMSQQALPQWTLTQSCSHLQAAVTEDPRLGLKQ